jgi:hypothetical protein
MTVVVHKPELHIPRRALLAGGVAAMMTILMGLVLTAPQTIYWILTTELFTFTDRLRILLELPHGFLTQFSLFGLLSLFVTAALVGVNTTLLGVIMHRNRALATQSSVVGTGGIIASLFGIGCASCGTIVVMTILGQFGSIGLLSLLPYGGSEFSLLGIALLSYTAYRLSNTLRTPPVCATPPN